MKAKLLLLVALFLGATAASAFGQSKTTTQKTAPAPTVTSTPCCGQTMEDINRFATLQEELLFTQATIHERLLDLSGASKLTQGVHLISAGPDGFNFRATVNSRGVVINWFVTEPSGIRLAQVNSDGSGGTVDVNRCMEEFLRQTQFCEWQGTFDSQYNYNRCYWEAWRSFLGCLERSAADGAIMR